MIAAHADFSEFGTTEIRNRRTTTVTRYSNSAQIEQYEACWRPNPRLLAKSMPKAQALPELRLRCNRLADSDQVRVAPSSVADLVLYAKLYGGPILVQTCAWSDDDLRDLHPLWFLYQKSLHTHTSLKRAFRSVKDFQRRGNWSGQQSAELELPVFEYGDRVNLRRLLQLGYEACQKVGIQNPKMREKIRMGLYAGVRKTSYQLPDPETFLTRVRQALYSDSWTSGSNETVFLQQVWDHFRYALAKHLDEPQERFDEWLFGAGNTVLTQITQKSKAHGEALDRSLASQAMTELGWRGFVRLSECVAALMRAVMEGGLANLVISEPSRNAFGLLYYQQEKLGGIPLCMLQPRISFVRDAVSDLLESPQDENAWEVFYGMLTCYSILVRYRREADREMKNRMFTLGDYDNQIADKNAQDLIKDYADDEEDEEE